MIVDMQPQAVTWVSAARNASTIAKVYLGAVVTHVLLLICLALYSLDDDKVDDVYAFLGMFTSCCFLYFSAQGIMKDNEIQLRCAVLSAFLMSIYLVWYAIKKDPILIIQIFASISALFSLFYIVTYKFIVDRFGWYRYNRLNIANKELLSMYYTFQIFKGMVYLDVEIVTVTWILIFAKTKMTPFSVIMDCILIFLEFVWALLGLRAVRTENMIWTRIFLFLASGMLVYVGLNAYWVLTDVHFRKHTSPNQYLVAMSLAIIVRFLLLYWLFRAANNYDKGLKEYIFDAGVDDIDIWGNNDDISHHDSTQHSQNYHQLIDDHRDDKHLAINNSDNTIDNDDDNYDNDNNNSGNNKSKFETSQQSKSNTNSKNNNNNNNNMSKFQKKMKKYSGTDENHSIGGAHAGPKYSNTGQAHGNTEKSQQSSQMSNFQRARISSDDFD